MKKCKNCKHCHVYLINSAEIGYKCYKNKDITEENYNTGCKNCNDYDCKFIEFPIEVSKFNVSEKKGIRSYWNKPAGMLVAVRPCSKDENKTYLGLLIGEIDVGLFISHNPDNKELNISRHYNPAIFVPELQKIIYGYESFWDEIESEEKLKEITDKDINNVWYMQLLKGMINKKNNE